MNQQLVLPETLIVNTNDEITDRQYLLHPLTGKKGLAAAVVFHTMNSPLHTAYLPKAPYKMLALIGKERRDINGR